ncbi:hypothetical protein ACHAXA_009083 [Cyclostephanos tholiformis]|uniref:PDZ domain-containing protein n=1 Tax=Cyclostephanos tholiformis TaxID=382380 RepID=A0ABD3SQX1_9STRA
MNVPIKRNWRKPDLVKWLEQNHQLKPSPSPSLMAISVSSSGGEVDAKRLPPPAPVASSATPPPLVGRPLSWLVDVPTGEKLGLFLKTNDAQVGGAEIIKVSPTSTLRGKVNEGDVVMKVDSKLVVSVADFAASEGRARRLEIWKGGGRREKTGEMDLAAPLGRSQVTVVPPPSSVERTDPPSSSAGSLFAMREEMGTDGAITPKVAFPRTVPRSSVVAVAATTTVQTQPARSTLRGQSRPLQRALKLQVAAMEQHQLSHPSPDIAAATRLTTRNGSSDSNDESAVIKKVSKSETASEDKKTLQILGEDDLSKLTYYKLREMLYELHFPLRKGWRKKDLVKFLRNHRLANKDASMNVPHVALALFPAQVTSHSDDRPQDPHTVGSEARVDINKISYDHRLANKDASMSAPHVAVVSLPAQVSSHSDDRPQDPHAVGSEREDFSPLLVESKFRREILFVSILLLVTIASLLVYVLPRLLSSCYLGVPLPSWYRQFTS